MVVIAGTPEIYIQELPADRRIAPVATSVTAFVGPTHLGPAEPTPIGSFPDFERIFGGVSIDSSVSFAVRDFFANGGTQAVIVRAEQHDLAALEAVDQFDLLCLPPPTLDGETPVAVYRAAMDHCGERRAMLLVDPPRGLTGATAQAYVDALGSAGAVARNAALYYPRIRVVDPTAGGQVREVVPCGAVAGVIARTDSTRGVWKSPAGTTATLAGTVRLAVDVSDSENGRLTSIGINCLRSFPSTGTVVWGARTLRGADAASDEYKYVPVRRTALFIEKSIDRDTQWVVFEPNDEPLWAALRLSVGAFLHVLFREGAFQGRTPREAYFVKCDRETTSLTDIENGRVNVVIGFAPLRPAEFVVLHLQRRTAQPST